MEVRVMQDILGRNDMTAEGTRQLLAKKRVFCVNLLGSPGAGKTTLLEKTLAMLKDELPLAVIEGDLFTTKDAERIGRLGVPVVQINTAGGCHLDAAMIAKTVAELELDRLRLIIIENVGNLVCPAEFDLGEDMKVTVLSVTEGGDKPLKYPLVFKEAAAAVISKTDLMPYTDFDLAAVRDDLAMLNPGGRIFPLSAVTGEGLEDWCGFLRGLVERKGEM